MSKFYIARSQSLSLLAPGLGNEHTNEFSWLGSERLFFKVVSEAAGSCSAEGNSSVPYPQHHIPLVSTSSKQTLHQRLKIVCAASYPYCKFPAIIFFIKKNRSFIVIRKPGSGIWVLKKKSMGINELPIMIIICVYIYISSQEDLGIPLEYIYLCECMCDDIYIFTRIWVCSILTNLLNFNA